MSPNTSTSSSWNEDQPAVELRNVSVIHRSRTGGLFHPDTVHAANDISLGVKCGETLGLVGGSSCGKSIAARVMVGLQPVTSGEAIFKGHSLGRSAPDRRGLGRSISVVFQDPTTAFNPRMIVHDILIDPLDIHRIGSPREREAKVCNLLHLAGSPPSALNMLSRQISSDQRQRVITARALTLDPDIIAVDEPASALDISVRTWVLNLPQDLKASLGLGLVLISYNINTVHYVSDRIAAMYFGKILEPSTTEEIFNNPRGKYAHTLLSAVPSLLDV